MRWTRESLSVRLHRMFDEWHPRLTLVPRQCRNSECGNVVLFEGMLSRIRADGFTAYRVWACSPGCAAVIDKN
jgi:hypothetical protein